MDTLCAALLMVFASFCGGFIAGNSFGSQGETKEATKVCEQRGGIYANHQCYKAELLK